MSYRTRVTLQTAGAVALVVVALVGVARVQGASALIATIDTDLARLAAAATDPDAMPGRGPSGPATGGADDNAAQRPGRGPGGQEQLPGVAELRALLRQGGIGRFGAATGVTQLLDTDGSVVASSADPPLPVTDAARAVAVGERDATTETVTVDDTRLRVRTDALDDGLALQIARSLEEADATVDSLTRRLLTAAAAGIVLAGLLGWLVAGRVVDPVRRLTALAEEISQTQDLSRRIGLAGDDEPARLAAAFDRMLTSLASARRSQQQLIADASHELRTPLTSLRTNIELLRSGVELPADDHDRLLADIGEQLIRFGTLVDGLIELARGEGAPRDPTSLRLDELVTEVAATVSRDRDGAHIEVQASPITVVGEPARLVRAVRNVLDNAVVHGGGQVEVHVGTDVATGDAVLTVRDQGPGVDAEDLPRVFDRFYRASAARAREGSGLGLAIVRQVVDTHGGRVAVANAPDGGAIVTLHLPGA